MKSSNYLYFNSISELMGELDNAPLNSDRETASDDRGRGSSWCDTSSWEEAHDYMLSGRTYDQLETDITKYRTKGCKEKQHNYTSVVGHNVIVPLYLQGVPTCMLNSKKTINNKIINIFYCCNGACNIKGQELIDGAVKLMENIISLEQDGYRCNLFVMGANNNDRGYCYILKLKTDRETLNIKKLCFPLVSNSFLRRVDFRIKERLYRDWIGGGYGSAIFDRQLIEKSIQKLVKVPHYEVWNYQGLQFKK